MDGNKQFVEQKIYMSVNEQQQHNESDSFSIKQLQEVQNNNEIVIMKVEKRMTKSLNYVWQIESANNSKGHKVDRKLFSLRNVINGMYLTVKNDTLTLTELANDLESQFSIKSYKDSNSNSHIPFNNQFMIQTYNHQFISLPLSSSSTSLISTPHQDNPAHFLFTFIKADHQSTLISNMLSIVIPFLVNFYKYLLIFILSIGSFLILA